MSTRIFKLQVGFLYWSICACRWLIGETHDWWPMYMRSGALWCIVVLPGAPHHDGFISGHYLNTLLQSSLMIIKRHSQSRVEHPQQTHLSNGHNTGCQWLPLDWENWENSEAYYRLIIHFSHHHQKPETDTKYFLVFEYFWIYQKEESSLQ